jgi:peptidoglycan-associated lipoprotein
MKISRIIMSLCVMAFFGFAITGCHNEPVDLGPVPPPKDGEPNFSSRSANAVSYDEFGDSGKGGKPGAWASGSSDLGPRGAGDTFEPIAVPGINFEAIYFEYDRSDLRPSEMSKLQKVAEFLNSRPELGLIIEGHCDDRGSEEYNRALGERRAISLRDQLVKMGVPDENMKTISYGKDRPAVQGTSAEARSRNRRGETVPARIQ